MHQNVEMKNWSPIKLSKQGLAISCLYFADDSMLFAKATRENLKCMSDIFAEFCCVLGQQE